MSNELFQPSINDDDYKETETYDIRRLFYVSFFGGIIPTTVLCTKCAKGLKLNESKINLMIVISVILMTIKVVFVGLIYANRIPLEIRYAKWIFKFVYVVLYLSYFQLLKVKFNQHIMNGGETKPLLKDAIIWILLTTIIEFALLTIGSLVIENVL